MQIVKPQVELVSITPDSTRLIEKIGRVCYKSEDRIGPGSDIKLIGLLLDRGHLPVIEHAQASLRFITDRGITHEMVRHRLAAYCQESTRYCNYSKGKFGGQIKVIEPPCKTRKGRSAWERAVRVCEESYLEMLHHGETPQVARAVLPTCLKTEIIMTCNFREWMHVLALRTSPKAHPQIVQVMNLAKNILAKECPSIFDRDL